MGKKPLYYWSDGKRLVFGSEIKSVLAHPVVPRDLDVDALAPFLAFGYVPCPGTFFAGIRSVPPGHVLTLEGAGPPRIEPYWEPGVPGIGGVEVLDVSLDEAATEVRSLLTDAVERRLVADVPVGAFLSGGLDSSAVVGIMAELSSRPVRTFTIGFDDEEGFDERPFARMVAERFATEHVEFVVQPHAVDLVERLVWHHDQPFGDSTAIPTFLLSELTRGHVTVALCGDGGDELFAGYERLAAALVLARLGRLPTPVRRSLAAFGSRLPSRGLGGRGASVGRFLARADEPVDDAFLAWVSAVRRDWRHALLGQSTDHELDGYHRVWASSEGADLLDRLLVLTMRTYLLDDLLPKVDRMSMAHALEVRSPFLDQDLVELALRLPRNTRVRGMNGKRVLKHAVRDLLPAEIINRRKHGFGVPLARWFRTDLAAYVDATLGAPDASVRSYLKPDAVDGLVAEHQSGVADHHEALWVLLTLEVFLRREGW